MGPSRVLEVFCGGCIGLEACLEGSTGFLHGWKMVKAKEIT